MHREIGAALEHGLLEFLDEKPLAADVGERPIENAITLGGQAEQVDLALRLERAKARLHMARLPHGESRFARGDDQS